MEANELRVGNYIHRKDIADGHLRTEIILEISHRLMCSGPAKVVCTYDEVEPITLTEEWLLKFGFDKREGRMFYFDEYKLALFDDGAILFSGSMFTGKIGSIKHVHQLQNLYYALTNQELEIK